MTFLTESDAARIAQRTTHRHARSQISTILRFMIGMGLLFITSYIVISAPAQLDRLRFTIDAIAVPTNNTSTQTLMRPAVNTLSIPAIHLRAPILWDVPLGDALNGLQQGVVHARETVVPGTHGRTFLIGHSAGYWWNRNPWTKVFSLLEQLEPGDRVLLNRDGIEHLYQVTGTLTVAPSEVNILTEGPTDRNQLALMTCTPVGTTLKRLIVLAEPITP